MAIVRSMLVHRAKELMQRELRRAWTVDALADELGVSRATLCRAFANEGMAPPIETLTTLRIEAAAKRLRESDASLVVIADGVGYRSEFALSRAFKRAMGLAPMHYRRAFGSIDRARMAA